MAGQRQTSRENKQCCERMASDLDRTCDRHSDRFDCPDMLIHQTRDGSYGLIVHDGGTSVVAIAFCPWCGTRLPQRAG
jgi:hypothetical protein